MSPSASRRAFLRQSALMAGALATGLGALGAFALRTGLGNRRRCILKAELAIDFDEGEARQPGLFRGAGCVALIAEGLHDVVTF